MHYSIMETKPLIKIRNATRLVAKYFDFLSSYRSEFTLTCNYNL